MRRHIICVLLLTSSLTYVYGQVDLNTSILEFRSICSEPIMPEETLAEFTLLELTTKKNSTILNFELIANCAQQKEGLLSTKGDTLIILETDVTITRTTRYEEADSAGLSLEITEETHLAEFASCDCLVNFYYQFSTSLKDVKFLRFHDRTFNLIQPSKNVKR